MTRARIALLGALLLTCGCAEALAEITDVDGPRVLAVTVRVVGDPGRSAPRPGETVRVTLVVADDGPRRPRDFEMLACLPAATDLDVGVCDVPIPGGRIQGVSDPFGPDPAPTFELVVPDAASLEGATELLVHGAVCADGTLANDLPLGRFPDTFESDDPCADPEDVGEFVVFRIPLASDAPNLAPSIAGLSFDGEPWSEDAALDAPAIGCLDEGLPLVPSDEVEHTLAIRLAAGSREAYAAADGTQATERPIVAFHATDGDFDGSYAFFSDDEERIVVYRSRDDRAPADVPVEGRLARFTFVVRDGRGGASAATRALCLVP